MANVVDKRAAEVALLSTAVIGSIFIDRKE